MDRVMAMKEATMTAIIPSELDVAVQYEWAVYLRELRSNFSNERYLATGFDGVQRRILVGGC